ncbi:MAG: A/G-specific adenine glycosylase, partial [Candidatus Omnitrophota bacterium]
YGVELKKKHANPSRKSASYIRQAAFEGSDRQIRGAIIRSLVAHEAMTRKKLFSVLDYAPARMAGILEDLKREGLVKYNGGLLTL